MKVTSTRHERLIALAADETASHGAGSRRPRLRLAVLPPGVLAIAIGLVLGGCGEDERETVAESAPPIEHVHGLGVNPADGALFIATHDGLFRSAQAPPSASLVGEERQDTMGFTVVGPDRFLGSGHPAPGQDRPPNLGLIRSSDAGETWQEVSLGGEVDFHILRSAGDRVYGVDALTGRLLISDDQGRTWDERSPPPGVIDLAIDPADPERMLAATENGLQLSEDDGARWRPIASEVGLLAWAKPRSLFLIDAAGSVRTSDDGGKSWARAGSIGSQPAAFIADDSTLYAASVDGTLFESPDAGTTWDVRSSQ